MIIAILALILALISPDSNESATVIIPPMPTYAPTCHVKQAEEDLWFKAYSRGHYAFTELFSRLEYTRKGEYAIMRRTGQTKFIYCKKVA